MMAERNAVVAAATKMIVETGLELEKAEAYAMAQDGYVRRSTISFSIQFPVS